MFSFSFLLLIYTPTWTWGVLVLPALIVHVVLVGLVSVKIRRFRGPIWVIKSYPTVSSIIYTVVPVILVPYTITAAIPRTTSLIPTTITRVISATSVGVPVLSGVTIMACIVALIVAWPHGVLWHVQVELKIVNPYEIFRLMITLGHWEHLVLLPELSVILWG